MRPLAINGMRKKMCGRKRFPIAAYLNPIKL